MSLGIAIGLIIVAFITGFAVACYFAVEERNELSKISDNWRDAFYEKKSAYERLQQKATEIDLKLDKVRAIVASEVTVTTWNS